MRFFILSSYCDFDSLVMLLVSLTFYVRYFKIIVKCYWIATEKVLFKYSIIIMIIFSFQGVRDYGRTFTGHTQCTFTHFRNISP